MTRSRLGRIWRVAVSILLVSCQPAGLQPEATTPDLTEYYGGGRLQLGYYASIGLIEYLNAGRHGLFAASRRSGNHAHRLCGRGGCSTDDARRVIEDCNRQTALADRGCALLVVGQQIVWRGQVVDPERRLAVLQDHNRRLAQALVVRIPGQSEELVATVYIDESHPIGLFTMQPVGYGGFCQGEYDFLSPESGVWDLRCNSGFQASGTFRSENLANGGSGIGTDRNSGEVYVTLLPRI